MSKNHLEDEAYNEIVENLKKDNGEYDDISSKSKKFELNTTKIDEAFESNKHSYKRKRHGILGKLDDFGFKISKWWKCMKKGKKALLITLLIFFVLGLTAFFTRGYLKAFLKIMKKDYNYDESFDVDVGTIDKDVVNIALFGIDSRNTTGEGSFSGNSDSIMILSLNYKTNKIKIISVLRDSLVPMEVNGKTSYRKINAAYALGGKDDGPKTAVNTLNNVFGLDIKNYAAVNFYGMADIIDAVGGLDVELTQNEVTARGENNHGINDMIEEVCVKMGLRPKDYYVTKWGKQHLNGIQAVAYSRIRYCRNIWGTSNDYGRTDRQRFVMEQLFNKVKDSKKSSYLELANALLPFTKTSLSPDEIIKLGWNLLVKKPTFEEYRIPQTSSDTKKGGPDMNFLISPYPSGFGSIVYYDIGYAKKLVHGIIYEDMTLEEFVKKNPIEKNDWYRQTVGGGSSTSSSNPSSSSSSSSPSANSKPQTQNTSPQNSQGNTTPETPQEQIPADTPPEETPTDNPPEETPEETPETSQEG